MNTIQDFTRQYSQLLSFRLPPASEFQENGQFYYIKFPMYKQDRIPEELLIAIYGKNFHKLKINFAGLKTYLNHEVPRLRQCKGS